VKAVGLAVGNPGQHSIFMPRIGCARRRRWVAGRSACQRLSASI